MPQDPVCGMDVQEKGSLKLTRGGQSYYFCGEHCRNKFVRENKIDAETVSACHIQPLGKWYKNKAAIVLLVLLFLFLLSFLFTGLVPFRQALLMYVQRIWWAVLLGFLLGGVIDYYVPREYVAHFLSRPGKKTIFFSVLLGFFMSACSHGILALSIELHKKGAANAAVVAFLLASPWANFPLTIMLVGFFGLARALYIVLGALVIAVITGLLFQLLERKGIIEKNISMPHKEGFSAAADFKMRIRQYHFSLEQTIQGIKGVFSGAVSLADMVLWWLLIGMGLAALAAAYIPQNFFHHYMGPTALGLLVTLVAATVMEVCSEGTAPLAFEI
ncbi:MAG: permease, partial [Candidatus Omnitrophota bacterium]